MIRIIIKEFITGDYTDSDYSIYIVWGQGHALYVGISRDNIWNRWFSRDGRHIYLYADGMTGNSAIGRAITNNLPRSLDWEIELRDHDDASQRLEKVEKKLIKELQPLFNSTHRGALTGSEIKLISALQSGSQDLTSAPCDFIRMQLA